MEYYYYIYKFNGFFNQPTRMGSFESVKEAEQSRKIHDDFRPSEIFGRAKVFCHHYNEYTLKTDGTCCKCSRSPQPEDK